MEKGINLAGETLEASVAKDKLYEIIGGLADSTLEKILDVGDAVPIFSYIAKGLKATIAVRDAVFLEKVIAFLSEIGKVPTSARQKMIEKIQQDTQYRQKFGKFSLLYLDRLNDEFKAGYLGRAAQYLSRGEITYDFYQRFAHIMDNLTETDLLELTEKTFLNFGRNTFHSFESLGLMTITLKIPTEAERKSASKMNPHIVQVSHRRLTDWGQWTKNILLDRPVHATDL
ncbi:hypothetical protein [Pedobacter sp. KBW01]|uniref:hypothetical protein n=1 Tax=Pedobacter sp. KBW01 TaxID=2153364 RepID=UPI000F5AE6E4|nr:hypothetical protein [Pedobacter sp. KBW01]